MMTIDDFKTSHFNVLGKNGHFQGQLKLSGDTRICGQVEGEVSVIGEASLIIERDGHLKGQLTGHHIEVFGHFEGDLNASGTLTVRSSGILNGKIHAAKLVIYPGAIVNMQASTDS